MNGVLVDTQLEKMIAAGQIRASEPIGADQIQPNSIDLRVGRTAYRLRASFLPTRGTVEEKLIGGLSLAEVDLSEGGLLERNAIYLVPLKEHLQLPANVAGRVNPKSSTGRLDIFCRTVSDYAVAFDDIPEGYEGALFLEIIPRSFLVRLTEGETLTQLRLFEGSPVLSDDEIRSCLGTEIHLHDAAGQEIPREQVSVREGIHFGVELSGAPDSTIGFCAKPNHSPIDLASRGTHPIRSFWERIYYRGSSDVILEPQRFYIFASAERLSIGPGVCAEMLPYDAGMGEIRSHYAGFFDSGFGWSPARPSQIVLEVRNYSAPYLLTNGQALFRVQVLRNAQAPAQLYGASERASHYQGQGLQLAKHFRATRRASQDQPTLFDE